MADFISVEQFVRMNLAANGPKQISFVIAELKKNNPDVRFNAPILDYPLAVERAILFAARRELKKMPVV